MDKTSKVCCTASGKGVVEMSTKEVHPIQKKRRRIIDRITFLKSLKWNDFIKQWVADLYDDLEVIDRGVS